MPYKVTYQESDGGLITTYSGVVTDEEFRQCLNEKTLVGERFISNEKVMSYRYTLSDCTDVIDLNISVDSVKNSANRSKAAMAINNIALMAVVAPNDLEFGMSRLWQAYAGSQDDRVKIFKTREEADNWIAAALGRPDEEI